MALALLPEYHADKTFGIFGVFLDTVSKMANFLPSAVPDPSLRYIVKSTMLYPPYHLLAFWDVNIKDNDNLLTLLQMIVGDQENGANIASLLDQVFRYGVHSGQLTWILQQQLTLFHH
jgi:hypothetical protein